MDPFSSSTEYLVIELLIAGRQCGLVEIPITVWRDAEGSFLSPAFSPNLRAVKVNMESTHGGDGTGDDEEERSEDEAGPASATGRSTATAASKGANDRMDQLALQ